MSGNKPIRTAVIDDGISDRLYDVGCLDFNIDIGRNLSVCTREGYNAYLPSHGTTCAAIIRKYAPEAYIGSIKILNDAGRRANRDQFATAIEWCIKNEIKLANISLGTIDFRDFEVIRHSVNKAAENGLILVAACNNRNTYTVPACLTNVIGVKCRKSYIDEQYKFITFLFDGIDIEASGRHLLTDTYGEERYTRPSNSFAAPFVTALVYRILAVNPDAGLEEMKEVLYKNALNFRSNCYNPYTCMIEDLYKKNIFDFFNTVHYQHVKVDIPVIAVYDTENGNVLDKLNLFFFDRGYYSVKASTDYRDKVSGSEYIPDGIEIGKFISMIYRKYSCEAIIIRISAREKLEYIEKNVLFDIMLFVKWNKDNYNVSDRNTTAFFPVNLDDIDKRLDGVFERMLKLLEGANNSDEIKA